ncbi:MAG: UDP-4-amino-4,6-dideoxy-N-acetyl-beta-L-altrosamine transaminase [Succinivibrionaceae bacterium]|nr:UDP-4-amino-4,6-dideoxy-N-acetyl-beta-L-altrosamine transaminase [Succinivibrionaceae bacterium]
MIPYGKQIIDDDDVNAVIEALKSPLITQGPIVKQFENALASYCGVKHAVAVNSGTAALHIACLALGIGKGDLVWVSPITFVASANCALYCGADVDFVDIDYETGNMSAVALKKKLCTSTRLPKAIIVVHLAGLPADMEEISNLARHYGIKIIEDACHALGARYKNTITGDCTYSDITVFSFHPVKAITTAEGGMAVTNDLNLANKMRIYGCHGITRDSSLMDDRYEGDWYYEQQYLGYNYRMPEINAALGLSQLKHLDQWVKTRNDYADFYFEKLSNCSIELPAKLNDRYCAYHLFILKVAPEKRKQIFDKLKKASIGVNVHYIPVYHQPYYQKNRKYAPLLNTEKFYQKIITVPLCPAITLDDLNYVSYEVKNALT